MTLTAQEWNAITLSLLVGSLGTLVSLPFAVALAYLLARWKSRGRWIVETLVNLPLVLPPVVTGFLLLLLFGRRGPVGSALESTLGIRIAFTWRGAVLAGAVLGFPLMVRAIRLAFQGVNPRLEAVAQTLGAGRWRTFFTISLPLAWRGLLAGCVLSFARALGEFGATIMLAGNIEGETQTIPLAIYSLSQQAAGMDQSWRLVIVSIVIASGAIIISEILERRGERPFV